MSRTTFCLEIAHYFIEHQSTVRKTAQHFNMCKSSVHNYLHKTLLRIDPSLFCTVQNLLDRNNAEKHLRGGEATKRKFGKQ